jgi:hypothetical protein
MVPGADPEARNRAPPGRADLTANRPHSKSVSRSNCATSLTPDNMLFLADGLVSSLEVYSHGEGIPFPAADMVRWEFSQGCVCHSAAQRFAEATAQVDVVCRSVHGDQQLGVGC